MIIMTYLKTSAAFLACTIVAGCTTANFSGVHPQSHFIDSRTSVTPIGRAYGENSRLYFFSPDGDQSTFKEEAIKKAIAQKSGASVLINYASVIRHTTIIPMLLGRETYAVDGQAARIETTRDE